MDQKRRNVPFFRPYNFLPGDFIQPGTTGLILIVKLSLCATASTEQTFSSVGAASGCLKRGGDGLRPGSRSLTLAGISAAPLTPRQQASRLFSAGACWLVQALSAGAASSVNNRE